MKNPNEESLSIMPDSSKLAEAGQTTALEYKSVLSIIERAASNPDVDIDKMERLLAMAERMQAGEADRAFARAFNALQAEIPQITADKMVPDKYGNQKYKFAPFEDIMHAIRPLLIKHGFTVAFSMAFETNRVIQTCTVQHIGGHSRSNSFAARIGNGPPGSSEAQADGAASTYAKRFALCNAFNIIIESDTDGRVDVKAEGELIPPDKIQYLKEQVAEVGYKEESFLKLAGVDSYEQIREGSYGVLTRAIEMKRNANRKPA